MEELEVTTEYTTDEMKHMVEHVIDPILKSFEKNYNLNNVIKQYAYTLLYEYNFNESKKEVIKEYISMYEKLYKKWNNYKNELRYIPKLKNNLQAIKDNPSQETKKEKLILQIQKNEVQLEKKKNIFIKGYQTFYTNFKNKDVAYLQYFPDFLLSVYIVDDYKKLAGKPDHNPYTPEEFTKTTRPDIGVLHEFYREHLNKELFS